LANIPNIYCQLIFFNSKKVFNNWNQSMRGIFTPFVTTLVTTWLLLIEHHDGRSQTDTYTWHNVAMGGGGFVTGIITSKTVKGLMYARTDVGGACRWDAASSRWVPLLDWTS